MLELKKQPGKMVEDFMSPSPETIDLNRSVTDGLALMKRKRIRHLPVVFGKRLVGTVSDRILKAAVLSKWGEDFKISDVMIPDPYVVNAKTSISEIVDHMISDKTESAIVTNYKGEAIGIFTSVDALRLLREQK